MEDFDIGKDFNRKTILVVDDEESIVDLLVYHLQKEGYDTLQAYDGASAVEIALKEKPDLILLDVMLPKMDGISVCKRIRYSLNVPILMISAKDTELDKVVGLEMGADDYITKPFQHREVMARIKANLRKAELVAQAEMKTESVETEDNIITVGDLTLDLKKVEARVKGEIVDLTIKEFEVLKYLAQPPGEVVTREILVKGKATYELTLPNKLEYDLNEEIDLTGATIKIINEYGEVTESRNATIDMFTNFSTDTIGKDKEAVFVYGPIMERFKYTVNDPIFSIKVTKNPTKTEYEYGEEIDLTGGELEVITESGVKTTIALTEATVDYTDEPGSQFVTVTYKNASSGFFYITIKPKKITVTIDDKNSVYGEDIVDLTYSLKEGSSLIGETKLEDVVSVSTTATSTSDVGEYSITGTVKDAKYDVTFEEGTYKINRATLKNTDFEVNQAEEVYGSTTGAGATVTSEKLQHQI